MDEPYLPAADFISMIANAEVPLTGSEWAGHNLRLLISFINDADVSNRDWATMVLAGRDIDTQEVRNALIGAAKDEDAGVRGEALQGLAERDSLLALPMVAYELQKDECGYGTFQAARVIGHPSLLDGLRRWSGHGGAPWIDEEINVAIGACDGSADGG